MAQSPTPIDPNHPINETTYYTINISCPKHPSDDFKHWMANKAGWTVRIVVSFSMGSPARVKFQMTEKGKLPDTIIDALISSPRQSADARSKIDTILAQTNKHRQEFCLADVTARNRYQALWAANRRYLGLGLPN